LSNAQFGSEPRSTLQPPYTIVNPRGKVLRRRNARGKIIEKAGAVMGIGSRREYGVMGSTRIGIDAQEVFVQYGVFGGTDDSENNNQSTTDRRR